MARPRHVDYLRSLLAAAGVPYTVEDTARCTKIRIAGRLVQTVPRANGSPSNRADINAIATVRRAIRHYHQERVK